jgi:hypothetical protein
MGLPSGDTEGGGGGERSGLGISSYHVYLKSPSIFSRRASGERESREGEEGKGGTYPYTRCGVLITTSLVIEPVPVLVTPLRAVGQDPSEGTEE